MDFTFLTCSKLADLDPDDRLALNVLTSKGYACQAAVWDDPSFDWHRAGICVLRSTWDYHVKFEKFMKWLEDVSSKTQIINAPHIVRWNVRKTYIRDLSALGVPVIPTYWLADASKDSIQAAKDHFEGSEKLVVKPTIGLATSGVKMVAREELQSLESHIKELLRLGEVMIQPYLSSVQDYGERSLIFLGGKYSHAARKSAFQHMATAGGAGERAVSADDIELKTARATIEALPLVRELSGSDKNPGFGDRSSDHRNSSSGTEQFAYARVDLIRDESNKPVVLEVELVEPSLFLAYDADAPARFAEVLERSMKNAAPSK